MSKEHDYIRKVKNISNADSIRDLSYSLDIDEVTKLMKDFAEQEMISFAKFFHKEMWGIDDADKPSKTFKEILKEYKALEK